MSIASIMTDRVVTVDMDDTLKEIRDIFLHVKFHHLLVVEHDQLKGVISDRDLFKALSPFLGTFSEGRADKASLKRRAHQVMTRKPITVKKDVSIEDASPILIKENVSCLPVVDEKGHIEGIVTWKDILKYCIE